MRKALPFGSRQCTRGEAWTRPAKPSAARSTSLFDLRVGIVKCGGRAHVVLRETRSRLVFFPQAHRQLFLIELIRCENTRFPLHCSPLRGLTIVVYPFFLNTADKNRSPIGERSRRCRSASIPTLPTADSIDAHKPMKPGTIFRPAFESATHRGRSVKS